MFLLVSILTETYPLVTNPFSTTWSPPAVLSGVVLKLSGSISVVVACRLLLMILITPSDVSPGVHPHRDLPSCHKPNLDKMVSAGGPQWRGTHDQWLVKRLNPVPVVIGDDFDGLGLFCGSALLGLESLPHPLSWVWDRSVFNFL